MLDIAWKCLATACVAGLGVLLVRYFWDQLKRNFKKALPPGPYGLPFVGYLPFMPKDGYRGVEALKNKYGTVFGVTLGSRYVVFLCDLGCIMEALSQDSLLNRPDEFPLMLNNDFQGNLLKGNVGSFCGAGNEMVLAAIDWLLLMSAVYPERQKKIQAEIDQVVGGTDRQVAWNDRKKMPYTQAFMWEVLRCKPVNPLSMMRYASKDVAVGSFVIPEGSIVIASFWSVFHDAELWGDPECFRPERFLVDGGTRALKPDWFIPFSYGKWSCPGELIAKMEVFIYFTSLLQHFSVEPPPNGPKLVLDEVLGLSLRPKPQDLVFRQR